MKLLHFTSLLANRPSEAYGRLEGLFDSRIERFWIKRPVYPGTGMQAVLTEVSAVLGSDVRQYLVESALYEIEGECAQGIQNMPSDAPFGLFENGDFALARMCYVLARALRPQRIVESGVCYGVTTSFLLQALAVNGCGELHSIDLPPLGRNAPDFVGWLVPPRLKARWHLHRGTSKNVLPRLLQRLDKIEVFVHDSLHTYRNMRRELNIVEKHLAPISAVISDDIEGNPAFSEWGGRIRPRYLGVVNEENKKSLLGVALLIPETF